MNITAFYFNDDTSATELAPLVREYADQTLNRFSLLNQNKAESIKCGALSMWLQDSAAEASYLLILPQYLGTMQHNMSSGMPTALVFLHCGDSEKRQAQPGILEGRVSGN